MVDLVGSFGTAGALFHPTGPTRWVDTRGNPAVLPLVGRLTQGADLDVAVQDQGAVPHDATAVWLNLTAVGAQGTTVLEAYPGPCGSPPIASSVNVLDARTAAASVLVAIGTNGGLCVRAVTGSAHVLIDLAGWFGGAAPGGLAFHLVVPDRLVDTRGGPPPAAGVEVAHALTAVSVLNVAAVAPTGAGFVTVAPCGATGASSLVNTVAAENVANLTVVGPGTGGQVCLTPSVASQLLADLTGVFVAPTLG